MASNFLEILNQLHDHHVDFVIAGLRERAVGVTVEGRTFFVASIDDLIDMKTRAGRPQDLLDIAELQTIRDRLDPPAP